MGLPVDRSIVTGFVQFADWGVVCLDLLGTVPETIYRGLIEMAWIRLNSKENDTLGRKNHPSKFEWTPYEDSTIRAVIPDELFVNPNTWHVKVPLVVYATIEMHNTDRVLRKFGFRQSILVAHQKLNDLRRIDLRHPDENWSVFHLQHINMWNNRYDFLPNWKPIIIPELACNPEYMPGFRIHGKPYLYREEARRQYPIGVGHDGPV
ncbi:hypothetical protein Gotri_011694 [Gossypium trilobum]|uniref:Aminotransferase-like plant mobile domain-containing protein n=1 Tax=Gossypium trilobum TaxID=34281 RepID=A0A7J9EUP8_9ROSI|nr:hypothetical protein [Gossypium trilobum]